MHRLENDLTRSTRDVDGIETTGEDWLLLALSDVIRGLSERLAAEVRMDEIDQTTEYEELAWT